jgi:hypothetical protein
VFAVGFVLGGVPGMHHAFDRERIVVVAELRKVEQQFGIGRAVRRRGAGGDQASGSCESSQA